MTMPDSGSQPKKSFNSPASHPGRTDFLRSKSCVCLPPPHEPRVISVEGSGAHSTNLLGGISSRPSPHLREKEGTGLVPGLLDWVRASARFWAVELQEQADGTTLGERLGDAAHVSGL